jgi:hypothetical protein
MNTSQTRRPPRAGPGAPMQDVVDANLADELADTICIRGLVANAERSSQIVDDGMNETEASEERHAAEEAQAMR